MEKAERRRKNIKMIKNFYQLDTWISAKDLTNLVYILTRHFPKEELFGLTSQIRRASVSVMANIAEGFARTSIKEKLQFYNQSHGSLAEVQSHILIAKDLGYMDSKSFDEVSGILSKTQGQLQGLMRSTRARL